MLLVFTSDAQLFRGHVLSSLLGRITSVGNVPLHGMASLRAPLQLRRASYHNLRLLTAIPSAAPHPGSVRVARISISVTCASFPSLPSLSPAASSYPPSPSALSLQPECLVGVV